MTAHRHAALMAQYAQDAAETDKPWERWEGSEGGSYWWQCEESPNWLQNFHYRRKPGPVKTETRTYECWDMNGLLGWCIPGKLRPLSNWFRVPSEDKTVEVVL